MTNVLQEAEEAAAAEVLKLTAELEMEEAGLQPFPEEEGQEDYSGQDDQDHDEKGELLKENNIATEDNQEFEVPDSYPMLLSDQQSYQLYVQASKPAGPDLEDANVTNLNDGADYADDNNTLFSQEIDIQHSNASDDSLRRRRVRQPCFLKSHSWYRNAHLDKSPILIPKSIVVSDLKIVKPYWCIAFWTNWINGQTN